MVFTLTRWTILYIYMSCLLILAHPVSASAEEISLAGDYGEPRIIMSAPEDKSIAHIAWPKVAVAPTGTIVVAAIAGEFHGPHGGGCPVVATSNDGGQTFGPMHILKRYHQQSEYTSAGNCALGTARDGSFVLLSMAFNGDLSNTIDGWHSSDEGRTWKPVDVSKLDRNQTGSVYGNVIQVPGQGLAVFGHYRKPAGTENGGLWIAWSTDEGRHWGSPRSIELKTSLRLVEPAVTYVDGQFAGLIRCGQDYYVQIGSQDNGNNWAVKWPGMKTDYDGPHMLPSPCLVPDPQHPQRLLALVSERHRHDGPSQLMGRVTLWQSHVTDRNWKKLGEIARFPLALGKRTDITYAWLAPLGGDEWYAVFYCGMPRGASDIYGLKVQIPQQ